jgi:serine/threonine protein kinase
LEMKVGDFGLAVKLSFAGERRSSYCGTLCYMAPE